MNSTIRQFTKANGEIDRALEAFQKERLYALTHQIRALDKYDEEMREMRDLDDIEKELHQMETQQKEVDHNIMRHINLTIAEDDDDDDDGNKEDNRYDEYEKKRKKDHKQPLPAKKIVPSTEVKKEMRVALFGFLEASKTDEDNLELKYEQAKEGGGKIADLAAENLYDTQIANLNALLRMLDGYNPRQSRNQWSKDPDYLKLLKKLNT